jgi:hypothetical protein
MWPLGFFLLIAAAAPQQKPLLPALQHKQFDDSVASRLTKDAQRNICFTIRSYMFRQQDGNAPVPAGMTTCTPANVLQERQVSPRPRVRFVPLGGQLDQQK